MSPITKGIEFLKRSLNPRPFAPKDNSIARYEIKYVVDMRLLEPIREFVSLFCRPDPYGVGTPPLYTVQTLQFDNHWGALYHGKEDKSVNRFKLRARTYVDGGQAPLFLEIKRKLGDVVVKSRAVFKLGWDDLEDIIVGSRMNPLLREGNEFAYLEFRRLLNEIGAGPVYLLRYSRESYMSENDMYARVTFDSNLRYQPCRRWTLDADERNWRIMDSMTAMNRPWPAFILELKTGENMPTWMSELIERFNLKRTDFCKYATAVRLESLYHGIRYSDASENCSF